MSRASILQADLPRSYRKILEAVTANFTVHDDFTTQKRFSRCWGFVMGIQWSPVDSPLHGPVMFICRLLEETIKQQSSCRWFETPRFSCDVTVMQPLSYLVIVRCAPRVMQILHISFRVSPLVPIKWLPQCWWNKPEIYGWISCMAPPRPLLFTCINL